MTRFNKEISSSSQPTTPTSTSTGRSVPPPLQVSSLTPTPHQVPISTPTSIGTSLPPPLQVSGLTPTPYQVPTNQMASLSPTVGSNPSTPTNIAPSLGTVDADPHSSSATNDVEECSNSRPMVVPVGEGFYPTKTASKAITATIKQHFDEPWLTWGQIPKTTRDVFFDRFKRKVSWKPEDEEKELFKAKFSQIRSETASVGASACSPLDPTEEETLRNRCWLETAGGKYKGHVYGIGNVNSQDDYVDSYIRQTQASSFTQQQNAEEIVNLKSQLQEYGQQLQKFEGFRQPQLHNIQIPQAQNHAPNDVQPEQQPPHQQPPD
ncbi:hypothetical protein LR48_Vigan553s001700 [Vigna angularis]|uniref:Uncharacterized protein n=1 Tax=Phaseolus angularis TaxID=3914 RepID=A0A0L9TDI6_PHAAN|nr:hypothetical protein LR48_Vigan553s001700 [Vigna angularis]